MKNKNDSLLSPRLIGFVIGVLVALMVGAMR